MTKKEIAIHEVGHSVLILHYGFDLYFITIDRKISDDSWKGAAGLCHSPYYTPEDMENFKSLGESYRKRRQRVERGMQVLAAGHAAFELYQIWQADKDLSKLSFSIDRVYEFGCGPDYDHLYDLGSCFFRKKKIADAVESAFFESSYILRDNWNCVLELTRLLMEKKTISRNEIISIWEKRK